MLSSSLEEGRLKIGKEDKECLTGLNTYEGPHLNVGALGTSILPHSLSRPKSLFLLDSHNGDLIGKSLESMRLHVAVFFAFAESNILPFITGES